MDSQFRCQCGKPMAYGHEPCKDCGSLGPHQFVGKPGGGNGPGGQSPASKKPGPRQIETPSSDRLEGRQPPAPRAERFVESEPAAPVESSHMPRSRKEELEFPVSNQPRSPILDEIDNLNKAERKTTRKQYAKEKDRDYGDKSEDKHEYEYSEDEEEKPKKGGTGKIVTTVLSAILIIAFIIGTIYVINNFDTVTKWLAKPTIPEFFKPSETPSSGNNQQQSPSIPPPAYSSQQADKILPAISDVVIKPGEYGATIVWRTSQPCTSTLILKPEGGENINHNIAEKYVRDHQEFIPNLESGKKYSVKILCFNEAGIESKPFDTEFQTLPTVDTTPPQLVGEPSVTVSDSTATIAWKTSEKAISKVKFGLGTGYEFTSAETAGQNLEHSIFISALPPDTTYHFQLISTDTAGNVMKSEDFQFKTESITDTAPYMGSKAPNFTLKNLKGEDVSLSQFRGKKVILNFWASWCTPCKVEMPHFKALWDKYRNSNDIILIAVAGSESDEAIIRSFVTESEIDFIVCLDPGDDVFNRYGIVSIPKTYFIDKGGVIRKIQQGMFTSPGEIEFMLDSF